jgi:hypothetical protein
MQKKFPVRVPTQNDYLLDITTEDIEHACTVLGVNNRGRGPAAGKHALSPRRWKEKAEAQPRRRESFARKLATSAFAGRGRA